jgi:hypothetical protein
MPAIDVRSLRTTEAWRKVQPQSCFDIVQCLMAVDLVVTQEVSGEFVNFHTLNFQAGMGSSGKRHAGCWSTMIPATAMSPPMIPDNSPLTSGSRSNLRVHG